MTVSTSRMNIPNELHASGLKATLPRVRVLQLFQEEKNKHLSAEEAYRLLQEEHGDIGLATIYRVLTQFTEVGILMRSQFESGPAVFELKKGGCHDHMVCVVCGKVEEFLDDAIKQCQKKIAKQRGFVIQEHSLSLYGVCSACIMAQNNIE